MTNASGMTNDVDIGKHNSYSMKVSSNSINKFLPHARH